MARVKRKQVKQLSRSEELTKTNTNSNNDEKQKTNKTGTIKSNDQKPGSSLVKVPTRSDAKQIQTRTIKNVPILKVLQPFQYVVDYLKQHSNLRHILKDEIKGYKSSLEDDIWSYEILNRMFLNQFKDRYSCPMFYFSYNSAYHECAVNLMMWYPELRSEDSFNRYEKMLDCYGVKGCHVCLAENNLLTDWAYMIQVEIAKEESDKKIKFTPGKKRDIINKKLEEKVIQRTDRLKKAKALEISRKGKFVLWSELEEDYDLMVTCTNFFDLIIDYLSSAPGTHDEELFKSVYHERFFTKDVSKFCKKFQKIIPLLRSVDGWMVVEDNDLDALRFQHFTKNSNAQRLKNLYTTKHSTENIDEIMKRMYDDWLNDKLPDLRFREILTFDIFKTQTNIVKLARLFLSRRSSCFNSISEENQDILINGLLVTLFNSMIDKKALHPCIKFSNGSSSDDYYFSTQKDRVPAIDFTLKEELIDCNLATEFYRKTGITPIGFRKVPKIGPRSKTFLTPIKPDSTDTSELSTPVNTEQVNASQNAVVCTALQSQFENVGLCNNYSSSGRSASILLQSMERFRELEGAIPFPSTSDDRRFLDDQSFQNMQENSQVEKIVPSNNEDHLYTKEKLPKRNINFKNIIPMPIDQFSPTNASTPKRFKAVTIQGSMEIEANPITNLDEPNSSTTANDATNNELRADGLSPLLDIQPPATNVQNNDGESGSISKRRLSTTLKHHKPLEKSSATGQPHDSANISNNEVLLETLEVTIKSKPVSSQSFHDGSSCEVISPPGTFSVPDSNDHFNQLVLQQEQLENEEFRTHNQESILGTLAQQSMSHMLENQNVSMVQPIQESMEIEENPITNLDEPNSSTTANDATDNELRADGLSPLLDIQPPATNVQNNDGQSGSISTRRLSTTLKHHKPLEKRIAIEQLHNSANTSNNEVLPETPEVIIKSEPVSSQSFHDGSSCEVISPPGTFSVPDCNDHFNQLVLKQEQLENEEFRTHNQESILGTLAQQSQSHMLENQNVSMVQSIQELEADGLSPLMDIQPSFSNYQKTKSKPLQKLPRKNTKEQRQQNPSKKPGGKKLRTNNWYELPKPSADLKLWTGAKVTKSDNNIEDASMYLDS